MRPLLPMTIRMITTLARRDETLEAGQTYDRSDLEEGRLIATGYAVAADRAPASLPRPAAADGVFEIKTKPGAPETRRAPRTRRTRTKG